MEIPTTTTRTTTLTTTTHADPGTMRRFLRTFFSGTGSLSRLCFNGVAKTAQALDTKGHTPDGIAWQFESFLEKGAVLRRESERGGGATFKHSA